MSNKTHHKMSNRKAQQKLQEDMVKHTHFEKHEVECMCKMFHACCQKKKSDKLERSEFRDILHYEFQMTDDIIMDRVFKAFDKDNDGKISQEEWTRGMSVFLRGDLEEQMQFCFVVYDMNADGYISKDEMFHLLKNCLTYQKNEEDPDEGVKDLVDAILKKLDFDTDLRVSFADFKRAVQEDDLLLESLGNCLPDEKKIAAFQETLGA